MTILAAVSGSSESTNDGADEAIVDNSDNVPSTTELQVLMNSCG